MTLAIWLFAACTAFADAPTASSNRFLFIIDTSANMLKWAEPVRESVFDLLYSGVRGHMTNGDSFGVWLAGGANDTSGGVETWKNKFAVELASRVAIRVKDHGFKGKPCLAEAIADAKHVAAAVGDVTVILVSNGKTPMQGTPFDAEINRGFQGFTQNVGAAKATLNTVLVAQDGEFVAWSVNSPDFLIKVPAVPPKKVRPQPIVATVVTNAPPTNAPVVASIAPPASVPFLGVPPATGTSAVRTTSRPIGKPLIITRETVDRERQATRAMAATIDERSASGTSSNVVHTNAEIVVVVPSNSVANIPTAPTPSPTSNSNTARSPAVNVAEIPTAQAEVATAAPVAKSSNVISSTALPETNRSAVAITTAPPPEKGGRAPILLALLWAGAGAFGGGAVFLLIWFLRRLRPSEVSLVSQAVAMERVRGQP